MTLFSCLIFGFLYVFYLFFLVDIKWVQQKMKEQHENELQALEVSSLVLICSVVLSTDGSVAVPGRNRTLFCCVFRSHYHVRSTLVQNFR